jgi:hypothetical protein
LACLDSGGNIVLEPTMSDQSCRRRITMSIKELVKWPLAALGVLLLGLVAFAMVLTYIAFYVPGNANVACSRDKDGDLVIDLRPNWRVRWVYDVRVWSEGARDYSWRIDHIGPSGKRRIRYGLPPPGSVQMMPQNGLRPEPVPEDGVFYVSVLVGWDGPFPDSGSMFCKFRSHKDGTIDYLGKSDLNEGVEINFPSNPTNPYADKPE